MRLTAHRSRPGGRHLVRRHRWVSAMVTVLSLLLLVFLTLGCTVPSSPSAPTPSPSDEQKARDTLQAFLQLLHDGEYASAVPLYGGSYDTMRDHNPGVPADDLVSLVRNACEINGAACLLPRTITLEKASPNRYLFLVEFLNEDGTVFVQGPCCGASPADQPPRSVFPFVVTTTSRGSFTVTEMPPYVP